MNISSKELVVTRPIILLSLRGQIDHRCVLFGLFPLPLWCYTLYHTTATILGFIWVNIMDAKKGTILHQQWEGCIKIVTFLWEQERAVSIITCVIKLLQLTDQVKTLGMLCIQFHPSATLQDVIGSRASLRFPQEILHLKTYCSLCNFMNVNLHICADFSLK